MEDTEKLDGKLNEKLEEKLEEKSDIEELNDSINLFRTTIDTFKTDIEKFIEYQSKKDEEVKGKDAISRGEVKINKYLNKYDRHFTIPRATASDPNDFDSSAYNNNSTNSSVGISVATVEIFNELERYADRIYVANDGTDTLFTIISHSGKTNFSKEEPIYPGDVKCYDYVYELRFRSPTINLPYRVSEYCLNKINTGTTSIAGSEFQPVEKASLHNQALPLANANWLGTDLTPTNTPTTFRINVSVSVAGTLSVIYTKGGVPMSYILNVIPGPGLVANGLYEFQFMVHSGDSINFSYSVTTGTYHLRVQEVDATTA